MKPLQAGQWIIRKHPKMLDRWFDHGGDYQSGPIKTANGKRDAHGVIARGLGIGKSE